MSVRNNNKMKSHTPTHIYMVLNLAQEPKQCPKTPIPFLVGPIQSAVSDKV